MTIARDGRFAAFLTDSQMTSYDNKGFRQIYTYERDSGILVCASCRPGEPPANDVDRQPGREIHGGRRAHVLRHQGLARSA